MHQFERDLFGNPIEPIIPIATVIISSADFENTKSHADSDDWRSRRDEEPERWDGLS